MTSYLTTLNHVRSGACYSLWHIDSIARPIGEAAINKAIVISKQAYTILSSPQAIKTYKMIWEAFCILCLVAIATGMSAREMFEAQRQQHPGVEQAITEAVEAVATEIKTQANELPQLLRQTKPVKVIAAKIEPLAPHFTPAYWQRYLR